MKSSLKIGQLAGLLPGAQFLISRVPNARHPERSERDMMGMQIPGLFCLLLWGLARLLLGQDSSIRGYEMPVILSAVSEGSLFLFLSSTSHEILT
jgi:hypothetical protein